jgi:hypothetical protein
MLVRPKDYRKVAISEDGIRMYAAQIGGYIYASYDSGANWSELTSFGVHTWNCLGCSGDGLTLVAGDYGALVYVYTIQVDGTYQLFSTLSSLTGAYLSTAELIYIGSNQWLVLKNNNN